MLRHTDVPRLARKSSVRFRARVARAVECQLDAATRGIKSVRRDVAVSSDITATVSSVAVDSESGAAVRTAWGSRPRRGAGFTSIQ